MRPWTEQIERRGTDDAESPAVFGIERGESRATTFGRLLAEARGCAAGLSRPVPPGGTVVIAGANRPALFPWVIGAWMAGLKTMLVTPTLTASEAQRVVDETGASRWISAARPTVNLPWQSIDAIEPGAKPCSPANPAEAGVLLQSSGTTGEPKIVFRDLPSLSRMAALLAEATGCGRRDRVLACIPAVHSYGIEHAMLMPLFSGAAVELREGFDVARVGAGLARGATILPGVPFMFDMLAQVGGIDRGLLRLAYSAGATLPGGVHDSFRKQMGLRLGQVYGMTELGSMTFNDPAAAGFDPMSAGAGLPGVQFSLREVEGSPDGEVLARSATMMSRLVGRGAGDFSRLLVDGFLPTGDLGRLSGAALNLTGRIKLMIDVGGMKVNPLEVESVLREHPLVRDAAVVPAPVSQTVNRLRAAVEARDGSSLDASELRGWVRERLSPHKIPRVIEVWDRLPRTPTGKVLRRQIEQEPMR